MARRDVPMSVRRLIVEVDAAELNVAEFCRAHGVSTWLFYALRRRYAAEGEAGLEPRSRAARRVANRTPAAVEDTVVAVRKELAELGLDAGAATIAFHLPARLAAGLACPSEATIWRVLRRRGFIDPDPSKAPKHAQRSFAAERANECWQIDDTGWALADGSEAKIINIIDDCTRLLIASRAVPACTAASAFDTFIAGAQTYGWPARFLSDNAKAFRHGLTDALAALGVAAGHSRPYHPQTCGKVERFHQTLKKFLAAQPGAADSAELQTQLDRFAHLYNHQRPHRALGRRIPAPLWADTPKAGPAHQPLGTPSRIYRAIVQGSRLSLRRDLLITVGAAYNHQPATVILTGTHCHVFIHGHLIRQLTIDPTRRTQPLGRHSTTVREAPRHA